MRPGSLNILVVTTHSDMSLEYFLTDGVKIVYFEDDMTRFTREVTGKDCDIVYIRDPFNTARLTLETIAPKVELIKTSHPRAYYVDQVSDIEGVLIEDKWRQYQRWGTWMPRTYLGGTDGVIHGPAIAKKRISARSRDIRFGVQPRGVATDWIVQERLIINEELRVYLMFGAPVMPASVRRPKGPQQTTKIIGVRPMSRVEKLFIKTVAKQMREFDFLGLDIAVTPEGLRLIEVNRSPQFKRYNKLSGDNLVAGFWLAIQKRLR